MLKFSQLSRRLFGIQTKQVWLLETNMAYADYGNADASVFGITKHSSKTI